MENYPYAFAVWTLAPLPKALDYGFDRDLPIGSIVEVPLGGRSIRGVVWDKIPPRSGLKIISKTEDLQPLGPNYLEFIKIIAHYIQMPIGLVLKAGLRTPNGSDRPKMHVKANEDYQDPLTQKRQEAYDWLVTQNRTLARAEIPYSPAIIKALVDLGAFEMIPQGIIEPSARPAPQITPTLSEIQEKAVSEILKSKKPVLLKGVTGSGKTEVYFEIAHDVMKTGRQVLVLLPEISLTDSFLKRCEMRFGFRPAHWHSGMSQTERRRIFHTLSAKTTPMLVGARSALFLPFEDLGLIIVDEEHDDAYKQEEGIIYNARDFAVLRAHIEKARVVLASATPSVETYYNAQTSKYDQATLNARFGPSGLPDIQIIDMRTEPPLPQHWIGATLKNAIQKRLDLGEQSLVFLNRRGFAPLTLCRACGHQLECPHCDARLVEHRKTGRLYCHRCDYSQPLLTKCPTCNAENKLAPIGPGIERIAQELHEYFPNARQCVLSSDLMTTPKLLHEAIEGITNGHYDLVIGTQMVAKGHNFPNLTLVGIVDADMGLEGADMRAAEKSFQILRQVTGRAGRSTRKGLAILQSYQPENGLLLSMTKQDDHAFYMLEIEGRRRAMAQPFLRQVGVIITAPKIEDAMETGRALLRQAMVLTQENIVIYGPSPAPITHIRNHHRVRMLLKMPRKLALHGLVGEWAKSVKKKSSTRIVLDFDPYNFL